MIKYDFKGYKILKLNSYTNQILNNISFELDNKNLIILGSNGVGKTTLARALTGIVQNNSTEIDGINPSYIFGDEKTKLINYIPSKLEIYDEYLTVLDFLQLNDLFGKFEIDNVLKIFDIEYLKNSSCKYLSSGESQLLLMSSAVLHNAKYTILDEPTANLDPQKVQKVYKILKDENYLQHKILITHNLDLAYKLGYDILYLKDGKIAFYDKSELFFDTKNLEKFFDNSVKKVEDSIMVNL